MAIYTKTGDKGQTSVFGGKKVSKFDPQIEATGALDESTSFIGFAIESMEDGIDKTQLTDVQMTLYLLMGYLAGSQIQPTVMNEKINQFEKIIDHLDETLAPLTRFILPQGSETASRLHMARVMVRNAERRVVHYIDGKEKAENDALVLQYMNRLSDYLFMMARKYTPEEKRT